MRRLNILKMMSGIDDKFIKLADEDFDPQNARHGMYITVERERFPWRAVFVSAACTAAIMFAVFVPIVRSGAIGFLAPAAGTESSENSGVVLSDGVSENNNVMDSDMKIDLEKEINYEVVLDSVFAYDKDSDTFKRYEWGDEFAPDHLLTSGRSYFRKENGEWRLHRQELGLSHFTPLELEVSGLSTSSAGTQFRLRESLSEKLGLPNFFKTSPNEGDSVLHTNRFIGDTESFKISITSVNITVDYDTNNLTISSDRVTAF